ncbi:MAG: hypothetical protein WBA74_26730 [Cyclobacteriaceae bacterium]
MEISIPIVTVDDNYFSIFSDTTFPEEIRGGLIISERIKASNFRLRRSEPGYQADWHVAGDPTFIMVRKGVLRLHMRNKDYRDFRPGDLFIAANYLPEGVAFDNKIHGHRAEVLGEQTFEAVHIKLAERPLKG